MTLGIELLPNALLGVLFSFSKGKDATVLRRVSKRLLHLPEATPYSVRLDDKWTEMYPLPPPLLLQWCARVVRLDLQSLGTLHRLVNDGVRFPCVRALCCFTDVPFSLFSTHFSHLTRLDIACLIAAADLDLIPSSIVHLSLYRLRDPDYTSDPYLSLTRLSLHSFSVVDTIHSDIYFCLLRQWSPTLTFLYASPMLAFLYASPTPAAEVALLPEWRYSSSAPLRHLIIPDSLTSIPLRYFEDVSAIEHLSVRGVTFQDMTEIANFSCMHSLTSLQLYEVRACGASRVLEVCNPRHLRSLRLVLCTHCSADEWRQFQRFSRLDTLSIRYTSQTLRGDFLFSDDTIRERSRFWTLPRDQSLLDLELDFDGDHPDTVLPNLTQLLFHSPRLRRFILHFPSEPSTHTAIRHCLSALPFLYEFDIEFPRPLLPRLPHTQLATQSTRLSCVRQCLSSRFVSRSVIFVLLIILLLLFSVFYTPVI